MVINSSYFLYISIAIGVLLLALVVIGYLKGFLYELVSILYTGLAIAFSWFVAPILASLYPMISLAKLYPEYAILTNFVNLDALLNTLAYFIIVFLVLKIFYFVIALLLKGMNKIPVLGTVNKILGAIMGVFNGLLICVALSMLLTLPLFKNGTEIRDGTILKYTNSLNKIVLTYVADNVDLQNIQKQFDNFDVQAARDDLKNWLENYNG